MNLENILVFLDKIKMVGDIKDPLGILPMEQYEEATKRLEKEREKIRNEKEKMKKISKKLRDNIKYDIGDKIETILGDIGYITAITIYQTHIKYCVRMTEDKEQWLYDWQIKNKKSNAIK